MTFTQGEWGGGGGGGVEITNANFTRAVSTDTQKLSLRFSSNSMTHEWLWVPAAAAARPSTMCRQALPNHCMATAAVSTTRHGSSQSCAPSYQAKRTSEMKSATDRRMLSAHPSVSTGAGLDGEVEGNPQGFFQHIYTSLSTIVCNQSGANAYDNGADGGGSSSNASLVRNRFRVPSYLLTWHARSALWRSTVLHILVERRRRQQNGSVMLLVMAAFCWFATTMIDTLLQPDASDRHDGF